MYNYNLEKLIGLTKRAANMVEVEYILSEITSAYLNKYAAQYEKAPAADNYGNQSNWIEKAVRFFISDIHRDKLIIWNNIPERFKHTEIYRRLELSQFVKNNLPVS